jgi:Carboxypeptidase regulatory-like domain/TonB dependent receptor/TonB-dependent Receptor Plug Domain
METQGIERLVSPLAKRGSEKSTLLRRAVRWGLMVLLPVLIVGSLTNPCAFAQTAQISGLITDSSGARLPNANITVVNRDTGISRSVDANTEGFYSVPLLQPGNYMVTAKSAGFATQIRTGITLEVGAQQVLNLTLQVGQMTQTVEVTTEAPIVELASSSISAVVNSTTVRELPLNGRSWTDMANLQPGVAGIQTQVSFNLGADRGNRGFGAQASISGARPQQNNYRLDGVSLNDYANGGPGNVTGGNLGVDAIQEFSVLTSNYSAEYGKTSGGVINAISRSGTNSFHGSAYEFLRNSALDARNFFDGPTIPPFKRNQFGASAGGPIGKGRTFIFGDYEAIRQSKGVTAISTVPSPAARAGNLSTGTVLVDPSVQKYLPFYPLPNRGLTPDGNGDTGIFAFAEQQIVTENFFTIRADHRFSEKDSAFGTYLYDNTPYTTPDAFGNVLLGSSTFRQIVVLEENHIFSSRLVNSVRFGFNRARVDNDKSVQAINPLAADPTLAAVPGRFATQVSVSGLTPFTGGIGANATYLYRWNSFQAYDDVFLTHGLHSIKAGVALERMQLNQLALSGPSGTYFFGSLANFLTNRPRHFDSGFANTLTPRGLRQTLLGLYLQDDWRLRPNLTLNLGLRYEMTTVPTEVQGKLATLINITDPTPHLGSPFFINPTLHNFEPRVGFAWDPFRNGKTAVRGGFGVFDVLPLIDEFVLLTNQAAPFYEVGSATNLASGSFFTGAFPLLGPKAFRETYIEHKPHRNYVMQWNLNVQRELIPDLTAMVGYVGSRGVHQPFRADDINIVTPMLTSQGYIWPSPVASGTPINPNFGSIKGLMWGGNSFFDAFEAQLTKRMRHGLQLQGSYTWGKSIDTGSATMVGDAFSNSISSLSSFDLRLDRGLSDFNIARTLVISAIWQLPAWKSLSGPAAWVMNGWELGAIYKANDGVPFTATFGTDGDPLGLNSSDPWDFPDRLSGPGCKTLTNPGNPNNYIKTQCFAVPSAPNMAYWTANCDPMPFTDSDGNPVAVPFPQCFNLRGNAGRNILIGPGTSNLDFSVLKNNPVKRISENFNVQFRAELFNVLNRANFAVPVTPDNVTIFDSTGAPVPGAGLLSSTTTTAREIQFALKLVW